MASPSQASLAAPSGGSPASPAALADCSEAVCAALRQLQEGYAVVQARAAELQVEKPPAYAAGPPPLTLRAGEPPGLPPR